MTSPLLSIIIPTKDRKCYITSAIAGILSIPAPELELVVEDNSSQAELRSWVGENISDSRLIYHYSSALRSMTDNYNQALARANGEYVCTIGDDDGVNPEIIEAARWAKGQSLEALNPLGGAGYCWPDFRSRYFGESHAGKLYLKDFSGKVAEVNPELELRRCVRAAGQGTFGLPKIYHGLIRRSCMLEVQRRGGAFFFGVSPDVSGAVAAANFLKKAVAVDYPLTLPGSSGGSNTGLSALGRHKGGLQEAAHLKGFPDLVWPKIVPGFFSVQTTWAQAMVAALEAMQREDLLKAFNVPLLYAMCAVSHRDYSALILREYFHSALPAIKRGKLAGSLALSGRVLQVLGQRLAKIGRRLLHPGAAGGAEKITGLENIQAAMLALSRYLQENDKSFKDCVS
jgi:glycosyltransferase involved in cell wall biosynthesis